jgi:alpha-tubulin suppressor-like RCC1 family protein
VKSLENVPISQVAAGQFHSLALNFAGTQLYSWGRGEYSALGVTEANGKPPTFVATPRRVFFTDGVDPPVINSIAAGESHSMAITSKKDIYTWGFGEEGQTGQKGSRDVVLPQKLVLTGPKSRVAEVDEKTRAAEVHVHQASGGSQHSVLLVTRNLARSG